LNLMLDTTAEASGASPAPLSIAVGRSKWLFTGGDAAAAMFSLIASAKCHGLNPWHYLADVFQRLPSTPTSQLDQFLLDRWQDAEA